MRRAALLLLLATSACGGDDGGSGAVVQPTPTPTPVPANRAPAITSAGSVSVAENTATDFYQLVATDADNDPISYAISGADAARFTLSSTGQLRFTTPPDFEDPTDTLKSNVYLVVLTASDGKLTTSLNLTVTVTNAADRLAAVRVGGQYTNVTAIAPVPGSKLIFVAQQDGAIQIVDPATRDNGARYLNITDARRLLNIAPAPDYATSGRLYVTLINNGNALELRRYERSSATAGNLASADILFRLARTAEDSATTSGWIGFGPDGLLYLSTGSANSAASAAADNLAGKILRIDVTRDDFPADTARDYGIPAANPFSGSANGREVFAGGFRDPRRASFDGNVLIVGDQAGFDRSEINLVRPEDAGRNYAGTTTPPVLTTPPYRIGQSGEILGGNVYRGPVPALAGLYIFYAGYTGGGIKSIPVANLVPGSTRTEADLANLPGSGSVTAIGEDADRNLYFAADGGIFVYRAD